LRINAGVEIELIANQRTRGDAADGFDVDEIAFAFGIAMKPKPRSSFQSTNCPLLRMFCLRACQHSNRPVKQALRGQK
jgi:hypothetical protein